MGSRWLVSRRPVGPMILGRQTHCSRESLVQLAAALVAVLATILSSAPPSAAANAGAETRVRTSASVVEVLVKPSQQEVAGQRPGNDVVGPVIVMATGVAAKPAIGFADDAVGSAYVGMNKGGGHAIRHLREDGLVSNTGSLASQVAEFQTLTSPILRSPTKAFDWRVGDTMSRAFAGTAGGRTVVVFVAKEGPYQGRVLSAVAPDASKMAQWGLP